MILICTGLAVVGIPALYFGYQAWVVVRDTTKVTQQRYKQQAKEVAAHAARSGKPPTGLAGLWARMSAK